VTHIPTADELARLEELKRVWHMSLNDRLSCERELAKKIAQYKTWEGEDFDRYKMFAESIGASTELAPDARFDLRPDDADRLTA
jgi:hypothetical protein